MSRSPQKDRLPRNILDAVYRTVHDFEGGAERLGQLLGVSPAVIDNKANPNASTPHLPTVPDVMAWQAITRDYRILHAMANALGHVAVKVPDLSRVSDEALLELFVNIGRKGGRFHDAVHDALADGRFSACEYAKVEKDGFQYIAAVIEAMSRMRGIIDE
jgi:hypothetical protein